MLKTEWPSYFQKDLEEALLGLVDQAYRYEPKEVITVLSSRKADKWYLPRIKLNGSIEIEGNLNDDDWVKDLLSKIGKVNTQGIQVLEGYVNKNDISGITVSVNNKKWDSTINMSIYYDRKDNRFVSIEKSRNYRGRNKLEEFFVDFENFEVIKKKENPLLYQKALLSHKELEESIETYERQLEQISNTIKNQLKSKLFKSRTKERHELFDQFLTTGNIDAKLEEIVKEKNIDLKSIDNIIISIQFMKKKLKKLEHHQLEAKIEQIDTNKV